MVPEHRQYATADLILRRLEKRVRSTGRVLGTCEDPGDCPVLPSVGAAGLGGNTAICEAFGNSLERRAVGSHGANLLDDFGFGRVLRERFAVVGEVVAKGDCPHTLPVRHEQTTHIDDAHIRSVKGPWTRIRRSFRGIRSPRAA